MPNPMTCCMCDKNDNREFKPYMLVSEVTLKAICESCVHFCSILIRDRKALDGGEYGSWL